MKYYPPSIFNAYNICPRQAWLMSRQLTADQENSFLDIGRLIDDTTYGREKKKIYIPELGAMIDMVTKKNGKFFVAEIKKSSRTLETGILQLKYYLYLLLKKSVKVSGLIKIPKEKKSIEVKLSDEDIKVIEVKLIDLKKLLELEKVPVVERLRVCPKCAHQDFCWS